MKKKNKIKILAISTLLTGVLGVSAIAPKYIKQTKAESENVININRENKKLVSYDDEQYKIVLSANETNNYTWNNFSHALYLAYQNVSDINELITYVEYDDNEYSIDESNNGIETLGFSAFISMGDYDYYVQLDEVECHFIYFYTDGNTPTTISYEYDLYLEFGASYYNNIKSAIELDIQANEPTSMGEQIIETIGSGLGLIGDLANEFLTGFSKILWDAENTKLTDFALFSLIMLGVAVSFAVVKLCLNIVRSNTGA